MSREDPSPTDAEPDLTVVIPTHQRESRLRFALEALAEQTLDRSRFEVVVVRSAATGGPLTAAPAGLEVRFERAKHAGAAFQRNLGWRSAAARLIAFCDDDTRPQPRWLEALVTAAEDEVGAGWFLQGRTEPDPAERHLLHGHARSITVTGPHPWYPSCNLAYPRELLERLGGFDESFPGAWGEDTDLALRAIELGAAPRYLDRARVWHAVHPRTPARAVSDALVRSALPAVIARHPRQRQALRWRIFLRQEGPEVVGLMTGLCLLARRPAVGVALTLPWALRKGDFSGGGRGYAVKQLARLPALALVDLAELASTVGSAMRNRVVVL